MMEKPVIKAVVIGGSNTIIQKNYLWAAIKSLKEAGVTLDVIENHAVGGTNIFNGLFGLKRSEKLAEADVLIIEYALNDTPTYADDSKNPKGIVTHWSRCYEGVIRYAREVNPNIRIVSIILEAKTKPQARRLNHVYAGIHYLTAYYQLELIDIASPVLHDLGAERAFTNEVYKDGFHYKPIVVMETAKRLVRQLTGDYPRPVPLPDPLDPLHFGNASAVGTKDFNTDLTPFANSRFSVDTIELQNQDLKFTLEKGKLLALFYVDRLSGGVAHFRVNDLHYDSFMRKPSVRSEEYPWLLGMISTEFLHKNLVAEEEDRTYTLTVKPFMKKELKPFRPSSNVAHESGESPTLAFYGLLHTGKMTDLTLKSR
ncbi:hypothetical protein ABAC460_10130 [Asticcacaulis sp. AC460]|nr:hypothetical protein ABAC460_10130 [Asticcacaulis sp. AC460]